MGPENGGDDAEAVRRVVTGELACGQPRQRGMYQNRNDATV
jgi:hypothetical protein